MTTDNSKWKKIGRNLRSARKFVSLNQDQVAQALGLTRTAITKMESGLRKVDAIELQQFANLYGQSVESLTGGEEAQPVPLEVQALARTATEMSDEDRSKLLDFARYLQTKQGT